MNIQSAKVSDAQELSSLIVTAVTPFKTVDFDDIGWKLFLKSSDIEATTGRIQSKNRFILCCVSEKQIFGFITIVDHNRIEQLYVLPEMKNKGIAKALWLDAKSRCFNNNIDGRFDVKSSTIAVPVYESFGFHIQGNKQVKNGIGYYNMQASLSKHYF